MGILVVEDEPTLAEAIAARLRAEGFATHLAGDGPAAVRTAQEHLPDLIVLDVMLPGFDGLEVCRRIQAERAVPVLMVTARDDESDLIEGLRTGADDYLTKPFSMRELIARVHALLRRVERAAELGARRCPGREQRRADRDRLRARAPPPCARRSRCGSWPSAPAPARGCWRSTRRSGGCGSAPGARRTRRT